MRQLKTTQCAGFKKKGAWKKHYTMTLWNNEEEMKSFARSGAHAVAMKESAQIAKEIRSITIDADTFPKWRDATTLVEKGKVIRF